LYYFKKNISMTCPIVCTTRNVNVFMLHRLPEGVEEQNPPATVRTTPEPEAGSSNHRYGDGRYYTSTVSGPSEELLKKRGLKLFDS
jgi:hypothetical protein